MEILSIAYLRMEDSNKQCKKEDVLCNHWRNKASFKKLALKLNKEKRKFKRQRKNLQGLTKNFPRCINLLILWSPYSKIWWNKKKIFSSRMQFSKRNLSKVRLWLVNFWEIRFLNSKEKKRNKKVNKNKMIKKKKNDLIVVI